MVVASIMHVTRDLIGLLNLARDLIGLLCVNTGAHVTDCLALFVPYTEAEIGLVRYPRGKARRKILDSGSNDRSR